MKPAARRERVSRTLGGVLALSACLLTAASAAAEPAWSPPEALYAGGDTGGVDIAAGPGGAAAVVGVGLFPSSPGNSGFSRVVGIDRRPGARWGSPRILSAPGYADSVAFASSGTGRGLAAWRVNLNPFTAGRPEMQIATRSWSASEGFGAIETVDAPEVVDGLTPLDVHVNGRGDAVVVWTDFGRKEVYAAVRRAGARFGPAERVTEPGVRPPAAVALSPDGQVAVGYERLVPVAGRPYPDQILEVVVRPPGRVFGAPEEFSADSRAALPQLGFDASGSLVALHGYGDGSRSPVFLDERGLQVSVRPAGGRFQPPTAISSPGRAVTQPRLSSSESGELVALWSESDGSGEDWQYASRPSGQEFGPPQWFMQGDQRDNFPDLRLDSQGRGAAAWDQQRDFGTGGNPFLRVIAAVRVPGLPPGASQPLTPFFRPGPNPKAAVDGTGRAYVMWSRGCVEVATYETSPQPFPARGPCLRAGSDTTTVTDPPLVQVDGVKAEGDLEAAALSFKLRCDEACAATVSGTLSARAGSAKLPDTPALVAAGRSARVRVRLDRPAARLLRRDGPRLSLRITAQNAAKSRRTVKTTIKLPTPRGSRKTGPPRPG